MPATDPGRTSDEARLVVEHAREPLELRRANDIWRTASTLFAATELDGKRR